MASLKEWLKAATPEDRDRLARNARTTVNYLYQLAGAHRGNVHGPRLALARAIVSETAKMTDHGRLPAVSLGDLIGTDFD